MSREHDKHIYLSGDRFTMFILSANEGFTITALIARIREITEYCHCEEDEVRRGNLLFNARFTIHRRDPSNLN